MNRGAAEPIEILYYEYIRLAIEMLVVCDGRPQTVQQVSEYLTKSSHIKSVTMMDASSTDLYVRVFKGVSRPVLEEIQQDLLRIEGVTNLRFI